MDKHIKTGIEKKDRLFQEVWGHILWGSGWAHKKRGCGENHKSELETHGLMWDRDKKIKFPMGK